jgi:hypothetical protein
MAEKHGLVEDLNASDTHSVLAHGVITDWKHVGSGRYTGTVEVDPEHSKNTWSDGGASFDVAVNSDKYLLNALDTSDQGWVIGVTIGTPEAKKRRRV